MAIRIVTDSVCDLPHSVAEANQISVVPLYVIVGGETLQDGIDIDSDTFYARLVQLSKLPTTSQPSVVDFRRRYQRLLDQGHQVVSIHVSSKLSGTCNSARQARASLREPEKVAIVDSQLAGGSLALLALEAARRARTMSDHHQLARLIRQSIPRCHGFVVIDTLKYLQMGGRIGKAQAFVGGILQFKPIVCIRDGEVHPVARPRTRRRAIAKTAELIRTLAPIHQMHLSYTTGQGDALTIRDQLADLVAPENIIESRFGPVLGTHLGPNTIGVAVTQAVEDGEKSEQVAE